MSADASLQPAQSAEPAQASKEFPTVFQIGGDIWVDLNKKVVTDHARDTIDFTPKEYALFAALARHACRQDTADALPWVEISRAVWGRDTQKSNIIRVHLNAVRKKLDPYARHVGIKTVPGRGIKLVMVNGSKPTIYVPK